MRSQNSKSYLGPLKILEGQAIFPFIWVISIGKGLLCFEEIGLILRLGLFFIGVKTMIQAAIFGRYIEGKSMNHLIAEI